MNLKVQDLNWGALVIYSHIWYTIQNFFFIHTEQFKMFVDMTASNDWCSESQTAWHLSHTNWLIWLSENMKLTPCQNGWLMKNCSWVNHELWIAMNQHHLNWLDSLGVNSYIETTVANHNKSLIVLILHELNQFNLIVVNVILVCFYIKTFNVSVSVSLFNSRIYCRDRKCNSIQLLTTI